MVKEKKRIEFIDALKGFAIICVVLGHIMDGYYKSNLYPDSNDLFWLIFVIIYSFHMGLFFVVSGYLYGVTYCKEKTKKITQTKRLIYVYIIWCILMWFFKIVFSQWVNIEVRILDIFLIPIKAVDPYWYLYVLIIYYLFFSNDLILNFGWKKNLSVLAMISLIASWLPIIEWFEITRLLYFSFFFYFGFCLSKKYIMLDDKAFIVGLIAVAIIFFKLPFQIDRIGGINWICALGVTVALFCLFYKTNKLWRKSKILVNCGKNSLEIYLIHCFLTAGFRVIFYRLGLTILVLNVFVNLILSIIVPISISYILKKIGIYKIFFKGVSRSKIMAKNIDDR